jgi:hypothetical protein
MVHTPLAMFACPSRRQAVAHPKPWDGTFVAHNAERNDSNNNVAARSDYAANAGQQAGTQYFGGPSSLVGDDWSGWHDVTNCNGICFERSEVRASHVRDGASSTIMLGEKYMCPDHYFTGKSAADNESLYTGFNNDNYRSTNENWTPRPDQPGWDSGAHFGSAHVAGVHVVLCDGSVHRINYSINPTTWARLGNRSDGQPVDQSSF